AGRPGRGWASGGGRGTAGGWSWGELFRRRRRALPQVVPGVSGPGRGRGGRGRPQAVLVRPVGPGEGPRGGVLRGGRGCAEGGEGLLQGHRLLRRAGLLGPRPETVLLPGAGRAAAPLPRLLLAAAPVSAPLPAGRTALPGSIA